MKNYFVLGLFSIVSGLAVQLYILEEWLFVVYIVPPPIEVKLGLFIIFFILFIAGVTLLLKISVSEIIFKVFLVLLIIDRSTIFVFYQDFLRWEELLFPLAIGVVVFFLYRNKKMFQNFIKN
jgi:hypothetical protein